MRIMVGADHRGAVVADHVVSLLRSAGHDVTYVGRRDADRVDYPDQAWIVAKAVAEGRADRGVLLSGSGIGTAVTANKVPGIRAVVGHDEWTAEISRSHHDTNILCLAADLMGVPLIRMVLERWMNTPFAGGRHQRRIDKVRMVEEGKDPSQWKGEEA